jgi:solute carrier family 8 (sodium/calcium exchanger)
MLLWLFLGISVLTDILHEAVWKITSKTEDIQVKDTEGKKVWIEEPLWNSGIANVTLMALAASAPEIFMCFFGTFSNLGSAPNQIGPIVLIGSASFNMLIGTGISILAASKVKKVYNLCSFLTTAAFATAAYIWLFVALLVVSPGVIEIKEAVITLLGYPILIITIWASEKISETLYTDEETERKRVCRSYLKNLAELHGTGYVLDINNLLAPGTDE